MKHIKPLILVILDGWGISAEKKGTAIAQAKIPTIEKLNHFYPHFYLKASGIAVVLSAFLFKSFWNRCRASVERTRQFRSWTFEFGRWKNYLPKSAKN
jgi:hypothetical protein